MKQSCEADTECFRVSRTLPKCVMSRRLLEDSRSMCSLEFRRHKLCRVVFGLFVVFRMAWYNAIAHKMRSQFRVIDSITSVDSGAFKIAHESLLIIRDLMKRDRLSLALPSLGVSPITECLARPKRYKMRVKRPLCSLRAYKYTSFPETEPDLHIARPTRAE